MAPVTPARTSDGRDILAGSAARAAARAARSFTGSPVRAGRSPGRSRAARPPAGLDPERHEEPAAS